MHSVNNSSTTSNTDNKKTLVKLLLQYADNALILGHRNSEWTGHGPILEQDIAISNIALDLIGQSRNFYQYTADVINENRLDLSTLFSSNIDTTEPITEDDLAYLRDGWDFKNCLLVEQQNGDWAQTILRQFFFSAYQSLLLKQLAASSNERLAGIAEKSLKEATYHLRWSSDWVIRLGDGTDESNARIKKAVDELWKYTGELFEPAKYEIAAQGDIAPDITTLRSAWTDKVTSVFEEATLTVPENTPSITGGKTGIHSEYLGFILAEMQYLQRAYPNSNW